MADAQLDNLLARKLNTFAPLSPDEARRLVELQSPITNVRRGKQLVQEGQAVRITLPSLASVGGHNLVLHAFNPSA
jgi:hypothetical protein